jgi:hypothetical protein
MGAVLKSGKLIAMKAPVFGSPMLSGKKLLFASLLTIAPMVAVGGCGTSTVDHSSSGTIAIQGAVDGGQQPVANSTIELYAAGKTGNGSPAMKMISKNVTTMADGTFTISGDYHCSDPGDQVYLVATGGNPGLYPPVDNAKLVMMTAFGSCVNLPSANYLEINEVTTVAAAWALAPFMKSATEIGAGSNNLDGIASAFRNANLLVDSSTGLVSTTLPSNLAIETGKLYALADALAPCVNSDGTAGCAPLFQAATPSGGTAPTNTLNAALSIVQNPGQNVAEVYAAINAQAPFPTTLTKAPHDWTMSLTVTGGGMISPGALGIDGYNNIWVANYFGTVSAFSAQGTPFPTAPYGAGILSEVFGLAVDFNNNVWVTTEEYPTHAPTAGSVTAFHGAELGGTVGSVLHGNYIYDDSIDFPYAIAADPDGDMLIDNYAGNSVTEYTNAGVFVASGLAAGEASFPVALSPDLNHGFWLANEGDGSVTHVDKNGNLLAKVSCCNGANGVATDALGNAWIANFYAGSVTELASGGAVEANTSGAGLSNVADPLKPTSNGPSGISVDAHQNVWVANYYGANFSEVAGSANTLPAGTAVSPSTGYGLDAHLLQPFTIAPDAAGNLWVSNVGRNTLTMFFGLATPTKTPLLPSPTAP